MSKCSMTEAESVCEFVIRLMNNRKAMHTNGESRTRNDLRRIDRGRKTKDG